MDEEAEAARKDRRTKNEIAGAKIDEIPNEKTDQYPDRKCRAQRIAEGGVEAIEEPQTTTNPRSGG